MPRHSMFWQTRWARYGPKDRNGKAAGARSSRPGMASLGGAALARMVAVERLGPAAKARSPMVRHLAMRFVGARSVEADMVDRVEDRRWPYGARYVQVWQTRLGKAWPLWLRYGRFGVAWHFQFR